ncbi:MAG: PEP-CTERM sorting domain-containing protein, partial [Planctomycetota bacterium]
VNFTPTVVSGYDLMETINADLSGMTMSFDNYGSEGSPSWFLNGVTYAGHSDIGYAGGENWWHQWVKSGADDWAFGSGMSGTVIHDGDSQGFVYGRAGAPVPEPATMTLLAAGLLLACRRK